jgi:hypothetical protein
MLLDERIDYFTMRDEGAMSRLFVGPHEAAIAVDVGAEYCGELSVQSPPRSII